jgi:hypothetical protein
MDAGFAPCPCSLSCCVSAGTTSCNDGTVVAFSFSVLFDWAKCSVHRSLIRAFDFLPLLHATIKTCHVSVYILLFSPLGRPKYQFSERIQPVTRRHSPPAISELLAEGRMHRMIVMRAMVCEVERSSNVLYSVSRRR